MILFLLNVLLHIGLLLAHVLFQIKLKWLIGTKVALDQTLGINAHSGVPILFVKDIATFAILLLQVGKGITQITSIQCEKDGIAMIIHAAANNITHAKGGSIFTQHVTIAMKDTAIITMVSVGIGIPSYHACVETELIGTNSHCDTIRTEARHSGIVQSRGPRFTFLGWWQDIDFKIMYQARCHGHGQFLLIVRNTKGHHKGFPLQFDM
mmetsp:Transcript_14746/g.30404  ORF Transcript_14746/g.30404 Transcript_14746/m.30404 type:complete len:209 (-) Transcript_14746:139-765(-)